MVPLYGHDIFEQMQALNPWVREHLPNSCPIQAPGRIPRQPVKRLLEWLLSGRLGDRAERWESHRKSHKFALQADQPGTAAEIDADSVKGHFNDHGLPILAKYEDRLRDYGLLEAMPDAVDPNFRFK
jgi:hypothetical protein